jgi:hypothetical protein
MSPWFFGPKKLPRALGAGVPPHWDFRRRQMNDLLQVTVDAHGGTGQGNGKVDVQTFKMISP